MDVLPVESKRLNVAEMRRVITSFLENCKHLSVLSIKLH